MWVNVLTFTISVALFAYWFRYTCLLLLSMRPAHDYAGAVVEANALRFPQVRETLPQVSEVPHLNVLRQSLDRDYKLLRSLIEHSTEFRLAGRPIERCMLCIDYYVMNLLFRVCHRHSIERGRKALEEMAAVLAHLANMMGEAATHGLASYV
ncbi:MAG TPA: hypothetical protein VKU01_31625 [Bryobacteraceae bacterium]|nr:hypothetical protein [Bryobacteraceae bacterium]